MFVAYSIDCGMAKAILHGREAGCPKKGKSTLIGKATGRQAEEYL